MNRAEFWQRVDMSGGPDACWPWTGARAGNGYGSAIYGQYKTSAHRAALLWAGVEIPPKHDVCHRCDNRICVNPSHLFVGTRKDNMQDAKRKNRMRMPLARVGTANPYSRLSTDQVIELRRLWAAGVPLDTIAAQLGVSGSAVVRAARGVTYSDVPGAYIGRRRYQIRLRPDAVSPKAAA